MAKMRFRRESGNSMQSHGATLGWTGALVLAVYLIGIAALGVIGR
jgi:hypothetical protein